MGIETFDISEKKEISPWSVRVPPKTPSVLHKFYFDRPDTLPV